MFSKAAGRISLFVCLFMLCGCAQVKLPHKDKVVAPPKISVNPKTVQQVKKIPAGKKTPEKEAPDDAPQTKPPPRGFLLRGDPTIYEESDEDFTQHRQLQPWQGQEQNNFPQYSPQRLAAAGQVRTWAQTKADLGIEIWLKTAWTQGQLRVRVAMLGDREALDRFVSSVSVYHLEFLDQQGNELMTFDINPSDFQLAPPTVNNGVPTLHFESSVDCALEPYEQAANWSMLWSS